MLLLRNVAIERSISEYFGEALDDERLSTEDGLMINHEYSDMRGYSIKDALDVIEEEEDIFTRLESSGYDDHFIAKISDEMYEDISPCFGFDLGTAGAVHAISAAGHAPVSSCNGGAFGDWHSLPNPWIIFYAGPESLLPLIKAAESTDVGLVPGIEGTVELYADDIRKFPRFSRALIELLQAADK